MDQHDGTTIDKLMATVSKVMRTKPVLHPEHGYYRPLLSAIDKAVEGAQERKRLEQEQS